MKRIFTLLASCIFFISLYAQDAKPVGNEKFDTVFMKNNDVKIGTVTDITDDAIRFVHKGETLNYTLKKPDVIKIVFSSGRVENISEPATTSSDKNTSTGIPKTDHHNKAAVLPFSFINNMQGGDPEMGYKVQSECYNSLSNKATTLNFQDPSTTNALLGKAGVTQDNFRNYTMAEICDILSVEYVVKGTVTSNKTSTQTTDNVSYNSKSSSDNNGKTSGTNKSSSGNATGTSTTQQEYKTSVLLEVYTDDGKKIFGKDRTSFWSGVDAYKSAIDFLLKKSPVYGK